MTLDSTASSSEKLTQKTKRNLDEVKFSLKQPVGEWYDRAKECFIENKQYLMDDYDTNDIDEYLQSLIKSCQGWFFSAVNERGEFGGVLFINRWLGNPNTGKYHSCHLAGLTTREQAWKSAAVIKYAIDKLFNEIGVHKIYDRVEPSNRAARMAAVRCGFKYEYTDKEATMKKGELTDILVYSMYNPNRR